MAALWVSIDAIADAALHDNAYLAKLDIKTVDVRPNEPRWAE